jgi:hypothetical protein
MKFLEKNLEDIIWEASNEKLQERGLNISGKKLRQLRIGNYGIADLVTFDRDYYHTEYLHPFLNITVYELKKDKAGISAFLQAIRYCRGIKSYLEKHKPHIDFSLNIVLCSKEIDTNSDYIFLCDLIRYNEYESGLINSISNYSFDYSIDGIQFKEEKNYDLINKGF